MQTNNNMIKKPFYKKWWFWLIIVLLVIGAFGSTGKKDNKNQNTEAGTDKTEQVDQSGEAHIYDNAEIRDLMNGIGDKKIGEYSFISVPEAACTEEALADWYYNYVKKNSFNWCMILYSDSKELKGCFSNGVGVIEKGVVFEKEKSGEYSMSSSFDATILTATDDEKTLNVLYESQGLDMDSIQKYVEDNIPAEYKESSMYNCSILTPNVGTGAMVSIQLADKAFLDETSCKEVMKEIIMSLNEDQDNYAGLNSFEFSFLKEDLELTFMINIEDAQSINFENIDESMNVTSF